MVSLGDRLREMREDSGLKQAEIAALSGFSQKDISKYESGKAKFIPDEYILFWYKKGFDITWMFTGKGVKRGGMQSTIVVEEPTERYAGMVTVDNTGNMMIPITDIKAAAGGKGYINTEVLKSSDFVQLPPALTKSGKYLCIGIKGHSMAPTLQDGGYVIIRLLNSAEWPNLLSDRVYVVCDNDGGTFLKRVRNRFGNGGFLVLTSDNPDKASFPNFNLKADEIISIWYVEWYLSAKLPNIHDQFYSKLERLENSIDDLNAKFAALEELDLKIKPPKK
jgi:phage repressor protein C with HTH and peptisase S24 domain